MNKVYIALFTCSTSRAIHLELMPSLTAESLIKALARLKGRRGTPTLIVSDDGKTFKATRVQATVSVLVQHGGSMSRQPLGGVVFFNAL